MRNREPGDLVVLAAAALFGGFLFLAVSDFALLRGGLCLAGEVDCARQWIGALSGWAAALAAGLTIFVLYRQTREARRQTEFIIGDAAPTAEIYESEDRRIAATVRLRIIGARHETLVLHAEVPDILTL